MADLPRGVDVAVLAAPDFTASPFAASAEDASNDPAAIAVCDAQPAS